MDIVLLLWPRFTVINKSGVFRLFCSALFCAVLCVCGWVGGWVRACVRVWLLLLLFGE